MRDLASRAGNALRNSMRAMLGWGAPEQRIQHHDDGATIKIGRRRKKSGSVEVARAIRSGPNHVHAWISRPDGSIDDCGVSRNLLTNIGRDAWANAWGFIPTAQNAPATTVTTTAVTGTSTTWTASNLGTPLLGLAGLRIYMPVTGVTTAPVYANIIANTTSVATIDQWWTAADGTGTTPANTNSFIIAPGGVSAIRFVALTTDSGAASASDTVLATEITTSGCSRALGTYAHTDGQSTLTLIKAFSVSGTLTSIHKAGAFSSLTDGSGTTAAHGGLMWYETVLNVDATVASGDTLTLTWTFTLSG